MLSRSPMPSLSKPRTYTFPLSYLCLSQNIHLEFYPHLSEILFILKSSPDFSSLCSKLSLYMVAPFRPSEHFALYIINGVVANLRNRVISSWRSETMCHLLCPLCTWHWPCRDLLLAKLNCHSCDVSTGLGVQYIPTLGETDW